ncbi:hypothetical protein [Paractinoplanes durhamensis]|uniref:hypothetical protein n=1 Tax=Paractinoplanes durhamensis TaxID=113563 RepID=UPI001943A9D2|nr:hypothetical protein [Actinoplanes durhamensis]
MTTLLEMADDGQTRPTPSDAWHLFLSGLRQRFRLPSGRPLAVIAAVLIASIVGGFGAAAGSWAAERTFADLPSQARVEALTRQASPGDDYSYDRSTSAWGTDTTMGALTVSDWDPASARDRFAADGWQVTTVRDMSAGALAYTNDPATGSMTPLPVRGSQFDAVRDGVFLRVTGYVSPGHGTVSVMLWPDDTAAMLPLMLAGAVLGLVAGWMLAAAGAYRMRPLPAGRRRVATVLTGLAVTALALPAFAFYVNMTRVLGPSGSFVNTVHSALNASPYWSYSTPRMLLLLTVTGAVLAGAAWATMGRRGRSTPAADQIPTTG